MRRDGRHQGNGRRNTDVAKGERFWDAITAMGRSSDYSAA